MLFPEPDTPVIVTRLYKGIFTEIFFKLFSLIPLISTYFSNFLCLFGISTFNLFERYLEVSELLLRKSFKIPLPTISPPK